MSPKFIGTVSVSLSAATTPSRLQEAVPDQLLNQFVSKRPEDKPFSYLPTGGMAELQQRSVTFVCF